MLAKSSTRARYPVRHQGAIYGTSAVNAIGGRKGKVVAEISATSSYENGRRRQLRRGAFDI